MIIIAESGSTKTNWLAEDGKLYETIGLNPLFHTSESIYNEIVKNKELYALKDKFSHVFFYGASCSSDERNKVVHDALLRLFDKASIIEVDHDMNAAAIATYTGKPGIACILGTGSNACFYDGKELRQEGSPGLGYVLGDEGSGAHFGKKLLSLFLYNELPAATMKIMAEQYKLEKEVIIENVYKKPHANIYLASFAKVMSETPDREFMSGLAKEGFTEFFQHHVRCYQNYQQYPVHFVGSIAYFFKEELKAVAEKFGCELGIVDRNPVYRLLEYHLKQQASQ
ncbi:MAG: hypothetical protein U0V74_13585 [Chitinophagales bacterium]